MTQEIKTAMLEKVRQFRLPAYEEIPNVGLYLEQVTKYISDYLAPLEDVSISNTQIFLVEAEPSMPVMDAVQKPVTLAGLTANHVHGLRLNDLRIFGAKGGERTFSDVE